MNTRCAPLLAFLFISVLASGESFRGDVRAIAEVSPTEGGTWELTLGQVLLVRPDPAEPFVVGLELDAGLDSSLSQFAGEIALQFYGSVSGPHQTGFRNMSGDRLATVPITATRHQYIVLPTIPDARLERGADDTLVDPAILGEDEWVAVQLVPLMKNLPPDPTAISVSLSVTPRLAQVGGLHVEIESLLEPGVAPADEGSFLLLLDGAEIPTDELIELQPGIYLLELRSADFVNRSENVGVERGRVTRLAVQLERPKATIRFSVPTVAEVLVDGNRVPTGTAEMAVEPGSHTFLIRIGDYSVSRQAFLNPEETYEIGVELDFFVRSD